MLGEVIFEWDEAKSAANHAKHGITLKAACEMWEGPVYVVESGQPGEPRKLALGRIAGRHWTIIFTLRGGRIRLISARRSRKEERHLHDENERQEP